MRLGFLGPSGTFSEEAAAKYLGEKGAGVPYPSIPKLVAAVEEGQLEAALLPLENSLEGSVMATLSALTETSLFISGEVIMPITHYLAVKKGTKKPTKVLSHSHALAQCSKFLEKLGVELGETLSTAAAAQQVANSEEELGAICPLAAAKLYQLEATKIASQDNLATRFIVLKKEDSPVTGHDKTSLLLAAKADQPGWLYQVLREFAKEELNLTRIESRPTGKGLGHYYFFIDFEGHRTEPKVKATLEKIQSSVAICKLLGSYPRAN